MWCLGHNSFQKKIHLYQRKYVETLHLTLIPSHTQHALYNSDFLRHKTRCYFTVVTVRPDPT